MDAIDRIDIYFLLVRGEVKVYGASGVTTPREKFGNTVILSTENSFISSLI